MTINTAPDIDEYRVRVYPGAPARTFRHPFRLRWGWGVQIDHISDWDEHGDAEQLNGDDWFDSQDEAVDWGIAKAKSIHLEGGCDECASLRGSYQHDPDDLGPLVVWVGGRVVVDERAGATR